MTIFDSPNGTAFSFAKANDMLGIGGFGAVFKAVSSDTNKKVAVKIVELDGSASQASFGCCTN